VVAGGDLDGAIAQAIHEWSQWTSNSAAAADTTDFGSGSRTQRLKWFRARLALWAKEQYGTWTAAGEALGCDEKTLRQDAAMIATDEIKR